MKNKQKFQNFLESLKDGTHDALIESIKQGFLACCESIEVSEYGNKSGGNGKATLKRFKIYITIDNDILSKLPKVTETFSKCVSYMKENKDLYTNENYTMEEAIKTLKIAIIGDCSVYGHWSGSYESESLYGHEETPQWEGNESEYNALMEITIDGNEFPTNVGIVEVNDKSIEKEWMDKIVDKYVTQYMIDNITDFDKGPPDTRKWSRRDNEAYFENETINVPVISDAKLKSIVYKIAEKYTRNKLYADESWMPVTQMTREINEVIPIHLIKAEYDNEQPPKYKRWSFKGDFKDPNGRNRKAYATITASGAGSVEDPLGKYDLTIVFSTGSERNDNS